MMRMQGALRALADEPVLSFEDVSVALDGMMSEQQRRYFSESADLDFAFQSTKLGRFRVNAFQHHRGPGVVLRVLAHAPHPLNNWLSQTQWPSLCLLTGLTSSVV